MSRITIQGYEHYTQLTVYAARYEALQKAAASRNEPVSALTVWPGIEPIVKHVLEKQPTWAVTVTDFYNDQACDVQITCSGSTLAKIQRGYVGGNPQYAGRLTCSNIRNERRGRRNDVFSRDPKKLLKEFIKYVTESGVEERARLAVSKANQALNKRHTGSAVE